MKDQSTHTTCVELIDIW